MIAVDMIADLYVVDGQSIAQNGVHRLDRFPLDAARGNIRLVGNDDHEKPCLTETSNSDIDIGQDPKIGHCGRRHQPAIALDAGVDDSITIEKDATTWHLSVFSGSFRSIG